MINIRFFKLLIVTNLIAVAVQAKVVSPHFRTYDLNDGLSSNTTTSITQDNSGFMWVGSYDGLNRFDGHQFKVFKHDPENSRTLSDIRVTSLLVDSKQRMWVGTWGGGLNAYNEELEQFTHFRFSELDDDSLSSDQVFTLFEDNLDHLWVGTNSGLNFFDPDNKKFSRFFPTADTGEEASADTIRSITQLSSQQLLIGSYRGLFSFSLETRKFTRFNVLTDGPSLDTAQIYAVFKDSSDRIWLATDQGVFMQPERKQVFQMINAIKNDAVLRIFQDQRADVLLASQNNGLFRFNSKDGQLENYRHTPTQLYGLPSNALFDIFEDKYQMLWIASRSGISMFNPKQTITHIQNFTEPSNVKAANNVKAVTTDNAGMIWLATAAGVFKQQSTALDFAPVKLGATYDKLPVISLLANKHLWLGSAFGLIQLDPQSGATKHLLGQNKSYANNRINVIIQENNQQLWLGTNKGLKIYHLNNDEYSVPKIDSPLAEQLSNEFVISLFKDNQNRLWIGTDSGGVYRYDSAQNSSRLTQFKYQANRLTSLSHNSVSAISQDTLGNIWLATNGGGVNMFVESTGTFVRYTQSTGLPSNSIKGLLADTNEGLWLSSDKGITHLSANGTVRQRLTVVDGLQGDVFNVAAYHKTATGKLLFGGVNGVSYFEPTTLPTRVIDTHALFTDFLLFNQSVGINKTGEQSEDRFMLDKSISSLAEVSLTHIQSLFSVKFASDDYYDPQNSRFVYRLSGWNEQWIEADAGNRFATFSNIPAGRYQLQLKTIEPGERRSKHVTNLTIRIQPAPWRTWWAYTIYCLSFVGLLFLFIHLYIRKKVAEKEQQTNAALLDTKERFFTNISHEFRTPLTLIMAPLQRLIEQAKDRTQAQQLTTIQRNSQRLLLLIEQILQLSQIREVTQTTKQLQHLQSTLDFIVTSFRGVADKKSISIRCSCPSDPPIYLAMVADSLERVLTNLLANAVKYTPEHGRISCVVALKSRERVTISISDSGAGISDLDKTKVFERFVRSVDTKDSAIGNGLGLALVKDIIDAHEGKITLSSEKGTGTNIQVELPFSTAHSLAGETISFNLQVATLTSQYMSATQTQQKRQTSVKPESSMTTILIVEDNVELNQLLVDIVSPKYNCIDAYDGKTGLQLANDHLPDLIISDVMMPIMNGFDMTHRLKSADNTNHIPVILLSGKNDKQSRLQGWREKADEYLAKPFDIEELLQRIENLLSIRDTLRKRYSDLVFSSNSNPDESTGEQESNHLIQKHNKFKDKLDRYLAIHYQQADLKIAAIASAMAMSERQLLRKLKAIIDMTPNEYLRNYRLQKALPLIINGQMANDVALDVGFSSYTYFARCFKAKYACTTTEYYQITMQSSR